VFPITVNRLNWKTVVIPNGHFDFQHFYLLDYKPPLCWK
jgi:hypothetical protein